MITNYKIKNENNEDILYIYLDFSYEFALFNFKDFGKNLRKYINSIISINNANKVKIVVSGIVIATLLVAPISEKEYHNKDNIIYVTKESFDTKDIFIEDKKEVEFINDVKDSITTEDTAIKEEINTNNNIPENNSINTKTISNNNNVVTESIAKEDINTIVNNTVDKITGTYVTVYRSNGAILNIELEEYLIGVVGAEMPASFNIEALKSQAIVARTYTLKRISENKILTDTTSTQVYKNNTELMNMWGNDYNKYYDKIKNAVEDTKGIYMTFNGNYIDAVYHSTSNGYTEDAINVWGNNIPYLKSVESPTDKDASSFKREVKFSFDELSNKLKINIDSTAILNIIRNNSNRVNEISINNTIFKGTDFRSILNLRSNDFEIKITDEGFNITTYGYGHGVGMSQYGANGMAKNGYNYESILKHYYQGINIIK